MGEYLADHRGNAFPRIKKHKWFFEVCVILGVAGELIGDAGVFLFAGHLQTIMDLQVARLNKETAQLNVKARNLEFSNALVWETNFMLRSNVAMLELKEKDRRITAAQTTNFVFLAERIRKIPIKIEIPLEGRDTETFAGDIRRMLNAAQFGTNSDAGVWGVNRDPALYAMRGTNELADVVFAVFSTNGNFNLEPFLLEHTPKFDRPIVLDGDEQLVYEGIEVCFRAIGKTTQWIGIDDNRVVRPGTGAIIIPVK